MSSTVPLEKALLCLQESRAERERLQRLSQLTRDDPEARERLLRKALREQDPFETMLAAGRSDDNETCRGALVLVGQQLARHLAKRYPPTPDRPVRWLYDARGRYDISLRFQSFEIIAEDAEWSEQRPRLPYTITIFPPPGRYTDAALSFRYGHDVDDVLNVRVKTMRELLERAESVAEDIHLEFAVRPYSYNQPDPERLFPRLALACSWLARQMTHADQIQIQRIPPERTARVYLRSLYPEGKIGIHGSITKRFTTRAGWNYGIFTPEQIATIRTALET